jgi:hypothetical protein
VDADARTCRSLKAFVKTQKSERDVISTEAAQVSSSGGVERPLCFVFALAFVYFCYPD